MGSQIFKVFISSTFEDLKEERKFVIDSLLSINCMPIAMEFFPGSELEPTEIIYQKMDECDYFVLVVKGKYGSIHQETGKSFTEMEYEYALQRNIPTLIFLFSEPQNLRTFEIELEDPGLRNKLDLFIKRVKKHTFSGWSNPENLAREIVISINNLVEHNKREGYTRPSENVKKEKVEKTFDQIETQDKKFGYIKFLHLSKKDEHAPKPIYHRYLPRLNKSIPVFDEYVLFRVNEFFEEITGLLSKDTSTGVVDLNILNPWQARLLLPEGTYEQVPGELEETIYNPSRIFVTTTHYYNAFQENQLLAIKMVKDTTKARLIVDFRYIPNSTKIINTKNIKAYLISGHNKLKSKIKVHTNFPEYGKKYVHIDSLFWINAENLKKGDVLRLDFTEALNWMHSKQTITLFNIIIMKNYVFGYGSLIEKNSRLRTTPNVQTGYPVKIIGYTRGWWSRAKVPGFSTTFLGCVRMEEVPEKNKISYVNGIVYEVTEKELLLTDTREQGYERIVIDSASLEDYLGAVDKDGAVWIYVNKFVDHFNLQENLPSQKYPIVQSYVDICINGCLELEALYPVAKENNFTCDFIKSTQYWCNFWVNDRIYPRRPFIAIPRAYEIDAVLKENLPDKSIFDQIYFE